VIANEKTYLVDAGPGVVRRAEEAVTNRKTPGLRRDRLNSLFISHLHPIIRLGKRQELVAILPCGGGAFSTLSLSGLSHNECRQWLLTERTWVRISFAEPDISTSSPASSG
jgi:hypothetical protein